MSEAHSLSWENLWHTTTMSWIISKIKVLTSVLMVVVTWEIELLGLTVHTPVYQFVPMQYNFCKIQLVMWDPWLPMLSPQHCELPGLADKEAKDAIRRLRNRNHKVKGSSLFHEDATKIIFVLNVRFGFGKTLTFTIRESTESFPLYS